MAKLKDLTNQRFGRLTVVSRAPNDGRYVCWNCKCDCGNEKIIRSTSLCSGRTQSCGCLFKETRPKPENLVGQRFGKLTVLEITELRNDRRPIWKCRCDCGNLILAKSHDLTNGTKLSCGCKNKSAGESVIEVILQENNIDYLYNKNYFTDLVLPSGFLGRYDFVLLKNNKPYRLIEYDGEQHFKDIPIFKGSLKERQNNDAIKNQYALQHNIPLVRIPYYELHNINYDMIFSDKYLVKGD